MLVCDTAASEAIAAEAARAAEGRWPRICERAHGTAAQFKWARCAHVL